MQRLICQTMKLMQNQNQGRSVQEIITRYWLWKVVIFWCGIPLQGSPAFLFLIFIKCGFHTTLYPYICLKETKIYFFLKFFQEILAQLKNKFHLCNDWLTKLWNWCKTKTRKISPRDNYQILASMKGCYLLMRDSFTWESRFFIFDLQLMWFSHDFMPLLLFERD